jgi:hypothetical protein
MRSLSRSAFLYTLIGTSWVALVENDLFPNFISLLLIVSWPDPDRGQGWKPPEGREESGLIVITMLPTIAFSYI